MQVLKLPLPSMLVIYVDFLELFLNLCESNCWFIPPSCLVKGRTVLLLQPFLVGKQYKALLLVTQSMVLNYQITLLDLLQWVLFVACPSVPASAMFRLSTMSLHNNTHQPFGSIYFTGPALLKSKQNFLYTVQERTCLFVAVSSVSDFTIKHT